MTDELDNAIERSIDAEITIRDFYLSSLEKVESKLARDVLEFLAAQELRHISDIQDFHKNLKGEMPDFRVDERIKVLSRDRAREFFGKLRHEFEQTMQASPHDAEIYQLALAMEKNGYEFYRDQAKVTANADARKLFKFLTGEEQMHYDLVESMSSYFLNPGDWFLKEEKWFFEG